MRLLNTVTQELKFFPERGRPHYAILSHTWEDDEVLFADIRRGKRWKRKAGAKKVLGSCHLARARGYQYIWIDTCCIDKSSSAELSEAINSMFEWYMKAEVCYVYLTDVAEDGSIAACRWFKRGWTLQELIAPTSVLFYDNKWHFIDDKISISSHIATYTGIDESLLRCGHSLNLPPLKHHHKQTASENSISRLSQLQDYCVAEKMSWASSRETTRGEDMAYCLMGLFGVNMPLLYGEGPSRAFFRLQREILENTHDQSILAFASSPGSEAESKTALASHPNQFPDSGVIHFRPNITKVAKGDTFVPMTTELTKFGVNVELLIVPEIGTEVIWYGILDFQIGDSPLGRPAIPLHPITRLDDPPVSCVRGRGLYEISPENPTHARRSNSGEPDRTIHREIELGGVKRRKITILQNFDNAGSNTYKESLPAHIHCVSNNTGCEPYSVGAESSGRAILEKPGYPRLLIHTLQIDSINTSQTDSVTRYSSMLWILNDLHLRHGVVPDNAENAWQSLAEMKDYQVTGEFGRVGLIGKDGEFYLGSRRLVVRGPSDLNVEVKVTPVDFPDWTMPGVTVYTTKTETSFEIEALP